MRERKINIKIATQKDRSYNKGDKQTTDTELKRITKNRQERKEYSSQFRIKPDWRGSGKM